MNNALVVIIIFIAFFTFYGLIPGYRSGKSHQEIIRGHCNSFYNLLSWSILIGMGLSLYVFGFDVYALPAFGALVGLLSIAAWLFLGASLIIGAFARAQINTITETKSKQKSGGNHV